MDPQRVTARQSIRSYHSTKIQAPMTAALGLVFDQNSGQAGGIYVPLQVKANFLDVGFEYIGKTKFDGDEIAKGGSRFGVGVWYEKGWELASKGFTSGKSTTTVFDFHF
ncbi:hypothetical protein ACYULU_15805 [Breznakiellaceae bacterium SP9]